MWVHHSVFYANGLDSTSTVVNNPGEWSVGGDGTKISGVWLACRPDHDSVDVGLAEIISLVEQRLATDPGEFVHIGLRHKDPRVQPTQ